MEELSEELEEQKELAANTLQELDALNVKYRENLEKVEELQMNVSRTFGAKYTYVVYNIK